jgi:anti-sigma factor RsiW
VKNVQCDDVSRALADVVDTDITDVAVERHIEQCLRCQAELARYRRMLRGLDELRTRHLEPTPGLLPQTLAAIDAVADQSHLRLLITNRRLAYAGAGVALAAGAISAVLLARSRRRAGFASAA